MSRSRHNSHWNPREKLKTALGYDTDDREFERVFVNGEEVDGIDAVPSRAGHSTHVVAYSENHILYRHYLAWQGNDTPTISTVAFNGDPHDDAVVNPNYESPEM